MRGFDLVGRRFGRLTVLEYLYTAPNGKIWKVLCECGNERTLHTGSLTTGNTQSCGCLRSEIVSAKNHVHGHAQRDSPSAYLYHAYYNAKRRCTDPKDRRYADYGGRGIEFRFNAIDEFISALGLRPSAKHSINREDNDGHYEKGNMGWATGTEQQQNRRT